jgi:hypothetical protein
VRRSSGWGALVELSTRVRDVHVPGEDPDEDEDDARVR